MKTLSGIAIIVLFALGASAQQSKVVTEIAASSDKAVKNSPFSADAVSESVQTLADGNRIVHSSTSKLYRNSEGRFRREISNGSGGLFGSYYSFSPSVTILDPVAGNKFMLDDKLKTAQQALIAASANLKVLNVDAMKAYELQSVEASRLLELTKSGSVGAGVAAGPVTVTGGRLAEGQLLTGQLTAAGSGNSVSVVRAGDGQGGVGGLTYTGVAPAAVFSGSGQSFSFGSTSKKYDTKTDQLGSQNIEGVEADGTRTTTTIPAGAIGNERPIEIVYERWYSKELQLVVMSKSSDPRTGEQTYRLTNILRSEPDPTLFKVPSSYRIVTQPTPAARATAAARVEVERSAIRVKATASAAPAPAAKARPQ